MRTWYRSFPVRNSVTGFGDLKLIQYKHVNLWGSAVDLRRRWRSIGLNKGSAGANECGHRGESNHRAVSKKHGGRHWLCRYEQRSGQHCADFGTIIPTDPVLLLGYPSLRFCASLQMERDCSHGTLKILVGGDARRSGATSVTCYTFHTTVPRTRRD